MASRVLKVRPNTSSLIEEDTPSIYWLQSLIDPARITVMLLPSRPNDETALAESGIRANLNCPLLLNVNKRLAMQKVLSKTEQFTLIRSVSE